MLPKNIYILRLFYHVQLLQPLGKHHTEEKRIVTAAGGAVQERQIQAIGLRPAAQQYHKREKVGVRYLPTFTEVSQQIENNVAQKKHTDVPCRIVYHVAIEHPTGLQAERIENNSPNRY